MNIVHFPRERLLTLFQKEKVVTMPQLKAALGTTVDGTVFRKLRTLPYRSSYSHRGAYYTLDSLAPFDARGLWSHKGICFSRQGTLLETAAVLVESSPAGYLVSELEALVQVPVKDPLRQLVQTGRLQRREVAGRYLYCAAPRARQQEQWVARQAQDHPDPQLATAVALFYGLLDEQQRRLYAGLESLERGHGGDRRMAELLGLDVETVARGRKELLTGQVLRQSGCGGGEAGVRGSKKNASHLERPAAIAARRHGGRSDGAEGPLDRQTPGADQPGVECFGPLGLPQHRAQFAPKVGIRFARQPQKHLWKQKSQPRQTVPLHQGAT
jgi:hypothetical protein